MTEKITSLFREEIKAVNIGVEIFYRSLQEQQVEVVQVDWKPPAGDNEKLLDILARLNQ